MSKSPFHIDPSDPDRAARLRPVDGTMDQSNRFDTRPLALPAQYLLEGALKDDRILDQHPLTECHAAACRLTAFSKTFGTFINHFSMETYQ